MSSFLDIDDEKRYSKSPAQGLDDTTLTAETKCSINFTKQGKKFCSSQHYNRSSTFLFVNGVQIHQFKAKDSGLNAYLVCSENIDWIV